MILGGTTLSGAPLASAEVVSVEPITPDQRFDVSSTPTGFSSAPYT